MIFITDENELDVNKNCLLYFYADWVPFNKRMILMLNKFEKKYTDITFYAINVDDFKNLCKRFSVKCVPSAILYNNGDIKKIKGLVLTSSFKNLFADC